MFINRYIKGYQTLLLDEGNNDKNPLFLMFCFQEKEAWEILEEASKEEGEYVLSLVILPNWDSRMVPFDFPKMKIKPQADVTSEEIPEILSEIEKECACKISERYLLGYSLGGLFAVYEGLKGRFDGFASVSGSLWYPGILEYVKQNPLPKRLRKGYFSIGDRETGKLSSPFFQAREKMLAVMDEVEKKGLMCEFDLNEGGHFDHPEKRVMKAMRYLAGKRR